MPRTMVHTAALVVLASSASAQQALTNPLSPDVPAKVIRSTANEDIAREACLALYKQIKEQPARTDESQQLSQLNGCLGEFPGLPGEDEAVAVTAKQ